MALRLHIAKPVEILAGMLSESTNAQALLGVASTEEAAAKIFYGFAEDEEFAAAYTAQQPKPLPRMLVALADFSSTKGTTSSWSTTVALDVMIESLTLTVNLQASLSARYKAFLDLVEGCVDDIRDSAATGTRLNIMDMSTQVEPQRCDPKKTRDIGEVWWCVFRVTAGG